MGWIPVLLCIICLSGELDNVVCLISDSGSCAITSTTSLAIRNTFVSVMQNLPEH
jgi:hypothetical protein